MGKPVIEAREVLIDLRAGMDDHGLMKKYRLSTKGLHSLFGKLVKAGVIGTEELEERTALTSANFIQVQEVQDIRERIDEGPPADEPISRQTRPTKEPLRLQTLISDVRRGLTDVELMHRYRLSAKALASIIDQLLDAGIIDEADMDRRSGFYEATVDVSGIAMQLGFGDEATKMPESSGEPFRCPACGKPQTIIFEECTECGINFEKYNARKTWRRKHSEDSWQCPACLRTQPEPHEECPVCGVNVARFKQKKKSQ